MSAQAERYTMTLRNLLFSVIGFAYDTPLALVLILGGVGYVNGWVSLGQVTAATLYVQALVEPLDRLIRNVDRLQVGIASTCRLLGIAAVPQDREEGDELPVGNRLVGRDLRFAYRDDHDVLHGIDLCCVLGSGWPSLGRAAPASPRWPAAVRHQQAAYRFGHGGWRGAHRAAAACAADRGCVW